MAQRIHAEAVPTQSPSGLQNHIQCAEQCWHKRADVSAAAAVQVHQHGWRGEHELAILDLGSQHITMSSLLEDRRTWKFYEVLDTSLVTVKASVSLLAQAKGSASYAEVNFADGAGAYIAAPTVMVLGPA